MRVTIIQTIVVIEAEEQRVQPAPANLLDLLRLAAPEIPLLEKPDEHRKDVPQ